MTSRDLVTIFSSTGTDKYLCLRSALYKNHNLKESSILLIKLIKLLSEILCMSETAYRKLFEKKFGSRS